MPRPPWHWIGVAFRAERQAGTEAMSRTDNGQFVFELPVWFVFAHGAEKVELATGKVGDQACVLLFTDAPQARRCIQQNHVAAARLGRLGTAQEVLDFLLQRLPADVTHVAFDVGQLGDTTPALIPWQDLAGKMQAILPKPRKT